MDRFFDSCVRRRSSGTCYGPPQPATVMVQQGPMGVVPPLCGAVVLPSVVYVAPTYAAPAVVFLGEFHPRYGWGLRHPQR